MSKVLVCGFPHCGTSIVKCIIGHISEVAEIVNETDRINTAVPLKKYTLCKYPFTHNDFFQSKYDDYIKIFIIRNPLFVFSSLNKRFNYRIPVNHSISKYIETIKLFINLKNNPVKNVYTIRYEDLFENNFKMFKNILSCIGFEYTDEIFENTNYKNEIMQGTSVPIKKPSNTHHIIYRTWQINQPFVSNNDISKIALTDDQKQVLFNDTDILRLYPDIQTLYTSANK